VEADEKREGSKTPPAAARAGAIPGDDDPRNIPGQPPLVDELPMPTVRVKPLYPDIAREVGVEGLVLVYALVGRDGRPREVRLDPEKHVPLLDAMALEAARQWRFEPAVTGGHPVAVWVSLPFRFSLRAEER
jgi:protein TonB